MRADDGKLTNTGKATEEKGELNNMNMNNQYRAAALYAGGWRSDEIEQIAQEYGYSVEDAEEVRAELEKLENRPKYHTHRLVHARFTVLVSREKLMKGRRLHV